MHITIGGGSAASIKGHFAVRFAVSYLREQEICNGKLSGAEKDRFGQLRESLSRCSHADPQAGRGPAQSARAGNSYRPSTARLQAREHQFTYLSPSLSATGGLEGDRQTRRFLEQEAISACQERDQQPEEDQTR